MSKTKLTRQYEKLTLAVHAYFNKCSDRHGTDPAKEAIQLTKMSKALNKICKLKNIKRKTYGQ